MWKIQKQLILRAPPHSSILLRRKPPYLFSLLPESTTTHFNNNNNNNQPSFSPLISSHLFHFNIFSTHHSFSNNNTTIKCWNCNSIAQTTPFLSCQSCRTVQPLDHSVDYFQIFGIEKKYDIEDKNLEGKYKEWQKKLHPDLVHSKSEREKEYAAEQSARVIDAYRTLSNPLLRAMYVLKLEGVDVDEEQTVSDPEMLAEILEIREAVEDATDPQALNQIQTQTQEKFNHWSGSFANAFRSKQYEEAQISIQRMTYYKRVNEEIIKKL